MFKKKLLQTPEPSPAQGSTANRRDFLRGSLFGAGSLALTLATGCGTSSPISETSSTSIPTSAAWKFGIMADSQWYQPDDGKSPYTVAVGIIEQIQNQFINNGVQFVIQVGDLTSNGDDSGDQIDVAARALFAQSLYNAGIGFFPIRGNHEDMADSATEFQTCFPQTQNGVQNNSPSVVMTLSNPDASTLATPTNTLGKTFTQGENFSSPDPWSNESLTGLSYSFDINNARFVMLDQFTPIGGWTSGITKDTSINAQQDWISTKLSSRPYGSHAFVISHKGLITPYHYDGLCGEYPSSNTTYTDNFINSLINNSVHYLFCGHDHMHDRSLIATTNGTATTLNQLVASSASCYNYYPRAGGTSDPTTDSYNVSVLGHSRRTPIAQETNTYGYYIVTVDGNNVTIDFYSGNSYATMDSSQHQWDLTATPTVNFTLKETFGYSLVGQQFTIPYNSSFTAVSDTSPNGTVAKILSGTNLSQDADYGDAQYSRVVNTGWTTGTGLQKSDILHLWGIHSSIGSEQSETYTLQMSYKASAIDATTAVSGSFGLASLSDNGTWINAVDANSGGSKTFVNGPWKSSYTLGTWGVDTANGVVWAVVNYAGTFVAATGIA